MAEPKIGDWVCGGPDGHGVVQPDPAETVVPCCPVCRARLLQTTADRTFGQVYVWPWPATCRNGHPPKGLMTMSHRGCACAPGGHATFTCRCGDTQDAPTCRETRPHRRRPAAAGGQWRLDGVS